MIKVLLSVFIVYYIQEEKRETKEELVNTNERVLVAFENNPSISR